MLDRYKKLSIEHPFFLLLLGAAITVVSTIAGSYALKLGPFQSTVLGLATFAVLAIIQVSFYVLEQHSEIRALTSGQGRLEEGLKAANALACLDDDPELRRLVNVLIDNMDHAVTGLLNNANSREPHNLLNGLFQEMIHKEIRRCADSLGNVRAGKLRVVGDEAHDLWIRMLSRVRTSFFTTNVYRFRDTLLGARANQHTFEAQEETVRKLQPGMFERLFLVDEEDVGSADRIIEKQQAIGIKAWKMPSEEFDQIARDNNWIERIGSPDFAVIDGCLLYLTVINHKTQRVQYVELHRSGSQLTAALEFVEHIRNMASLFDGNAND